MERLTRLSLRQRSVVILATVLIAALGGFAVTQLRTELIPDISVPVATIITPYPGASPESVDTEVSVPITQAVQSQPGLRSVQTISSDSLSVVVAEYEFGEDMAARQQDLEQSLRGIRLPEGAQDPDIQRLNINQLPVVQFSLTGANGDLNALRDIAQQQFAPELTGLDGVSRVEVIGGTDDAVLVALDPARLSGSGVTPQQIAQVLQANNVSMPAGAVQADGLSLPVRVGNQIGSVEALQSLVIGAQPGADGAPPTPITLGDVANIQIAPIGASGVSRTNGEPSVSIAVYMSQGANTVDTAGRVRDALDTINQDLANAGTNVNTTIVLDQSDFIEESISGLVNEALRGAIFAILVIFVFLLSIRSTLVTAISIPLSVMVAFILLWWQGITLNIMTLGGLAVAIGRVVDDAIVVLESIFRHVQQGEDTRRATFNGTKEVAMAITASTLTTIAVFLPLGLIGGLVGEIFLPFALTVTFALLASLLVALTVVPVLASFFIRKDKLRKPPTRDNVLLRAYTPSLRWALGHPAITLIVAFVVFVASLGLIPVVGTSFLPATGQKAATVEVALPSGTAQDVTLQRATDLEQIVRDSADTELIQTEVGGTGLQAAFTGAANNRAIMTVIFNPDVDLQPTLTTLRQRLEAAAGDAQVTVSDASSGAGISTNSIQVIVQGESYDAVSQTAQALTDEIRQVPNLVNVSNDVVAANPQITVQVDPAKAAAVGSSAAQIASQVRNALTGVQAGQVTVDSTQYPVQVIVANAAGSVDALRQLPVGTQQTVPLSQVAEVTQGTGPTQVMRVDGNRSATVEGTITTNETGSVIADVTDIVNRYSAPEGVTISMGGISEQQSEAFSSMGLALIIAVAVVYIVMVASFGSLTTPFVILFSLPLAVIGVLLALVITGKPIGLPSLIGVLMLVGIVVTNAIVLLELVISLRNQGMPLTDALIQGGRTRLRPILMTALATILALLPLALSGEGGAIIASDLAVVVIGGLLTSTLLTLIVVPVIYKLIAGWQERRSMRQAEAEAAQVRRAEPAPED